MSDEAGAVAVALARLLDAIIEKKGHAAYLAGLRLFNVAVSQWAKVGYK